MMKSINPYNQQILATYQEFSDSKIQKAITLSAVTYTSWKTATLVDRIRLIKKLSNNLRSQKVKLVEMMTLEMGKIKKEALAEVEKCAWLCDYYADNAHTLLAARHVKTEMYKSYVTYQPLGTVLAVMPWNFPFWQVFRAAVPALLAGNTMLLKHASNVFGCALLIEQLFLDSGFPKGAFISLLIGSQKVEQVIKARSVVGVALTGSEMAGSAVASLAGKNIKRQVLELGGSDAFIVLDDADLAKAADVAVASRMLNAGQSCIASKRFFVEEKIQESFLDEVIKRLKKLKIDNPLSENTNMGPMARVDLADELHAQLQKGLRQGAQVMHGGNRDQCLFEPTLLYLPTADNILASEETFGPLMPVVSFSTEQEAIRMANDSRFGLGGSVWTRDLGKGEEIALQVEAGAVFVNGMVRSDPRLPFGGIKDSGYGRELSQEGILEFVNTKTVVVEQ